MSLMENSSCPQRPRVLALAADVVAGAARVPLLERRALHEHLETCRPCRRAFRRQAAARFPRIRNYTLLQELGAGGFGVVYKAVHHEKERTEAIKVLAGHTTARVAYFENEVHLVSKLSHPNIATLYEAHLTSAPLFYSMEFVDGEQLHEHCRRLRLPLEDRLRIIRTVALAIGHAHRQGVVHRDLKPQNILIDDHGLPRVVDFGIARRLHTDENDAILMIPGREGAVGTVGYIPPEQLAGRPVDGRADIFALGAILRETVTGEPVRHADRSRPLTQWLRQRHVSRPDDLAAIIARCMAAAPEERYQSCEALANDLDNYLVGRALREPASRGTLQRAARLAGYQVRYHPHALRAAIVVAAAALLALLLWVQEVRQAVPGGESHETVIIAFQDSTAAALRRGELKAHAPDVDPANRKSLRALHGRLLEALVAARPSVIVMDYYFPDAQPRYDPAFAAGAEALRRANIPLVVAAARLDLNSEPVIAPSIRASVHAAGLIRMVRPDGARSELRVPICVVRGFNPPFPSLALAASAAARYPDCVAEYHPRGRRLDVQYRLREFAPGQQRWRPEVTQISLVRPDEVVQDAVFQTGDRVLLGRVPRPETPPRAIPYEDVLNASPEQLRAALQGRAVIVGQMTRGEDEVLLPDGARVFGCEVHADALQALLAGHQMTPLSPAMIMVRALLWCALAGAACGVAAAPTRGRLWPLVLMCGLGAPAGLVLAIIGAAFVTDTLGIELMIALAALLTAGGPAYLVNVLRRRQLHLTPEQGWSAGASTISATMLRETRATGGSPAASTTQPLPAPPG